MLQIERVLCIARGMVGGRVQGVEAVILVLDLGTVGDYEPDLAETADDILSHLRERMELADDAATPGQGEIRGLLGQGGFEFELAAALSQGSFELDLGAVDGLARGGFLFLGQCAKLLHQGGELAISAQVVNPSLFKRRQVRRGAQLRERRLFQRFNLVQESSHNVLRLRTKEC